MFFKTYTCQEYIVKKHASVWKRWTEEQRRHLKFLIFDFQNQIFHSSLVYLENYLWPMHIRYHIYYPFAQQCVLYCIRELILTFQCFDQKKENCRPRLGFEFWPEIWVTCSFGTFTFHFMWFLVFKINSLYGNVNEFASRKFTFCDYWYIFQIHEKE